MQRKIGAMLLIVLGAMALSAQAGTLYRWTDAQGKVHYSDKPPPSGVKAEEREMSGVVPSEDLPYATRLAVQRFPVVLYMNSCGESCGKARAYLIKRGVPYSMKNPETDTAAREELRQKIGGVSVPSLAVGKQFSKGFEESAWAALLDGAGYPRNAGAKAPKAEAAASAPVAEPAR